MFKNPLEIASVSAGGRLFLSPYENDGLIRESAGSAAALTFAPRSC
jgi:hypothetical protein